MKFIKNTPTVFKNIQFIPIQFKGIECMFQTPRLYVTYGKKAIWVKNII